jgi:serine/threonine-protein kinase
MLAGEKFGRYEISGKIGEGGMGEVYSARDLELDRNVAIKLLPNEFTADEDRRLRFRQEAKVVSALNHPNVITIYEIGENDFGHFLATEFVEGRTLREIIKRESLNMNRILRIMEQAANALVAAHSEHIVHRDIKPENIMVRRDGIVKVLDFGLAKPIVGFKNEDNSDNKTVPGTVMGSARYMSPEQARGLDVDERTDIWSLGVVLYELLIGKAPFDGETTADTLPDRR